MLQVLDASSDTILGLRIFPLIGCLELWDHPRFIRRPALIITGFVESTGVNGPILVQVSLKADEGNQTMCPHIGPFDKKLV